LAADLNGHRPHVPPEEQLDVVLLGAVGAGKGTQARRIAARYHIPHLASGDLLRAHRAQGTPLGQAAQEYMVRGALVPDDLVISMIVERMRQPDASHGVLLDGFPRTVTQAQALDRELADEGRSLSLALYLNVPEETLVARAAGRWTCRTCGATYNYAVSPPRVEGVCDLDGGPLYQREDDRHDVVVQRIEVYLRETVPVLDYYQAQGILVEIDGTADIETVAAALVRQVEALV
jgi:adenylate kinase